jgi:hypothetical protein
MSESSRDRPQGVTSGSGQRPTRRLAGPSLVFDVSAELDSLHTEASWQRGDRNARTLVEEPGFRLVLAAARAGTRIQEHRTPGWVSIETVAGHLQVHVAEQVVDLPRGATRRRSPRRERVPPDHRVARHGVTACPSPCATWPTLALWNT